MNVLNKKSFNGGIIITDPFYIVKPPQLNPSYPKKEEYISPEIKPQLLLNDSIANQYKKDIDRYEKAVTEWEHDHVTDWDMCNYGDNMETLGFKNFLVDSTEYGPWSCQVQLSGHNVCIGRFSSDSNLVGVFLLDEVLRYNASFQDYITKPWSCAYIPNFEGIVYVINTQRGTGYDARIQLIGRGNLDFDTIQVGF